MICTDLQPLQIVENKGFINFVETLNSDYVLPNRKTLSEKYLPELYQAHCSSLCNMLDTVKDIAITTDMWISDSNKCYLTVTAHFIFNSKIYARTLTTIEVKDAHSSAVIANVLQAALEKWRILDKVVTIVTDNASNMKNAISNFLNKRNHYCVAHTLNLVVMDSRKTNTPFTPLLSKYHNLVKFFKQSSKADHKLTQIQEQINAPIVKLKQDVITGWKSIFLMTERLLQTKIPISAALSTINSAPENLSANEWEQIQDCVNILNPIEQMTNILSGEKYPSLSSAIPLVRNVQISLMRKVPLTEMGKELKNTLLNQISKRLGVLESNKTAAKSTLLDPRYKKTAFGLETNAERAYQWVLEELGTVINEKNDTGLEISTQCDEIYNMPTPSGSVKIDSEDLWEHFDKKVSKRLTTQTPVSSATLIMKQYIDLPNLNRKLDPILYWEERKKVMPELYNMAMKYLCIPATSVPAERVFSKAALVCNQRRNRLDPKKIDEIIFLNSCDF
ncbi:unnamed protein product [Euphydryas editha]|uniref:HAT C-terminal dimerisation domain-containing protein n=1 Tax=Euphydryas editha TaxID=104508 RepID=A0AAU9UZU1_EUPED|nr:unnamed protein product [Euphydryas editha]